jgi:hypothetical protein
MNLYPEIEIINEVTTVKNYFVPSIQKNDGSWVLHKTIFLAQMFPLQN